MGIAPFVESAREDFDDGSASLVASDDRRGNELVSLGLRGTRFDVDDERAASGAKEKFVDARGAEAESEDNLG